MSYICERCGKVVEDSEKFGSGRFCSRACANTRQHSVETKEKIRQGVNKETICTCSFCGKEFKTLTAKASHERLCEKNPNKLGNPTKQHMAKLTRPVVLYLYPENIVLDITYGELEQYREKHRVCEICGRAVEETVKYTGKFAIKQLCVDHDHATNKFRGLLCQVCNRQLGWYENNKEKINNYLNK
jgi:hypothetical protein